MPLFCTALPVKGYDIKFKKFLGGNQLRQNGQIIISRIGGIVGNLTSIIDEAHEAGVFNASAFVFRKRER